MSSGGQFGKGLLPDDHQQALRQACVLLIDQCFDDVTDANDPDWNVSQSWIATYLPRRYMPRYTPLFVRQFSVCVQTVAWKIAQRHPPSLVCLAEELALAAILSAATSILDLRGEDADFSILEEHLYEDFDFRFLFDPARDGIDESFVGEVTGMGSLALENWFEPFGEGSHGALHPYLEEHVPPLSNDC